MDIVDKDVEMKYTKEQVDSRWEKVDALILKGMAERVAGGLRQERGKQMDTGRLMDNIIEQIKEAQLKLGFARESIRLYYPVRSLCRLLQIECQDAEGLCKILKHERSFEDTELGTLRFAIAGDRIEVCVPPQGADHVHAHVPDPPFLAGLIRLFQDRHVLSIEEIHRYFAGADSSYVCEQMEPGQDMDYVFYFPDGRPDAWFYCIRMEMGHTIYHRFTKEDYEDGSQ